MTLVPCGSRSAYTRHLRRGEETDEACRAANARYRRELRQRRKAGAAPRFKGRKK